MQDEHHQLDRTDDRHRHDGFSGRRLLFPKFSNLPLQKRIGSEPLPMRQ